FVGYSMGGTIAQLVAREHREAVTGIVLSATSQHFQDRESARLWRTMGGLRLLLSVAPRTAWRVGFRRVGLPVSPHDLDAVRADAQLPPRRGRGRARAGPLRL